MILNDEEQLNLRMAGIIFAKSLSANANADRTLPITRAKAILQELRDREVPPHSFALLGETAATIYAAVIPPAQNKASDAETVVGWTIELFESFKRSKTK